MKDQPADIEIGSRVRVTGTADFNKEYLGRCGVVTGFVKQPHSNRHCAKVTFKDFVLLFDTSQLTKREVK